MAESTVWWLLTGLTVAVELVTGTFYLLMLAIGMAVAALSAHLGASLSTQFVVETIMIAQWNPDGTADVQYRGARWTAIHRAGATPSAGAHRVAEMVGNRLLVDKA
jgi:membrane protein implicated in regulation of membrane protease activity